MTHVSFYQDVNKMKINTCGKINIAFSSDLISPSIQPPVIIFYEH